MSETPPLVAELVWSDGLRFDASTHGIHMAIDADSVTGPSPMEALAFGVAGCMAADVVAILRKGRQPLEGMRVVLTGARAEAHPRRLTHVHLAFHAKGAVGPEALDRAIALSKDKYCPALHSLREDIGVEVSARIDA